MKNAKKSSKLTLFFLSFFIIVLLAAMAFGWYWLYLAPQTQGSVREGLYGFLYTTYGLMVFCICLFLVMGLICRYFLKRHASEKKSLRFMAVVVFLLPAILVSAYLFHPYVQDVLSLPTGRLVVLSQISVEQQSNGSYITGINQSGRVCQYVINDSTYDRLEDKKDMYARLQILPYSSIVMQLDTAEHIAQKDIEKLISKTDLEKDYTSMQMQVDDSVYTLGDSVSAMLSDGWVIDQSEKEQQTYATLQPDQQRTMRLENKNGSQVVVTIKNISDTVQESEKAVIVQLDTKYANDGIRIVLPGQIALGWSSQDAVLSLYGQPKETKDEVLKYENDQVSLQLIFDDTGILQESILTMKGI